MSRTLPIVVMTAWATVDLAVETDASQRATSRKAVGERASAANPSQTSAARACRSIDQDHQSWLTAVKVVFEFGC